MPSRIIREGINSSPRINALSQLAELFYRRLMTVADDYGRYHASPATLRGSCWPTCPEKITDKQISGWLDECCAGDNPLIIRYSSGGANYLQIQHFGQQTRSKSKFPCFNENALLINCEANAQPSRSRISYFDSRISESLPAPAKPSPNGSRFDFPEIPAEWEAFGKSLEWESDRVASVFDSFGDYWRAQPGAKGRKTDWLATWRNWCRRENEKLPLLNGRQKKHIPNYRSGELE